MTKYFIILFFVLIAGCSRPKGISIHFVVEGYNDSTTLLLSYNGKTHSFVPDSIGMITFTDPHFSNQHEGLLQYGNYILPLYLEEFKNFNLYINFSPDRLGAEFSGEGAIKNEIWNGKYIQLPESIYTYNEQQFLREIENMDRKYSIVFDSIEADEYFKKQIIQKNTRNKLPLLVAYPEKYNITRTDSTVYVPSPEYIQYVTTSIENNNYDLHNPENREAFIRWLDLVSKRDSSYSPDPFQQLKVKINYIANHVTNQESKEATIHPLITNYVAIYGIGHIAELKPIYSEYVHASDKQEHFNQVYQQWRKLTRGEPAPNFNAIRQDSSKLTLRDFRGRYLYLGIWSTASSQTIKELSFYRGLRYSLKDQNITFAAICYGKDFEQWKDSIQKYALRGIQLYMENEPQFLEDYIVNDFPRFILIDTRGNILDPDTKCPSHPKTLEELKRLWPQTRENAITPATTSHDTSQIPAE